MRIFRGAGLPGLALLVPLAVFASPSLLTYATYLNGASANAVVVDASGNALVAGNGFVVKLNPSGSQILSNVSLPGDNVAAAALDASGNLAIAGSTSSGGFVGKLDPTGKTIFLNALPSAAAALAVDTAGNIYVTGATPVANHGTDAFVMKFSSAGAQVYSITIGGSANDAGYAIAVDAQGDAYIAGETESADFPVTTGAAQTAFGGLVSALGVGSFGDGFVAKFNATDGVVFATYWGGSTPGVGIAYAITVDAGGNAYVAGATSAPNFPVSTGAFQMNYAGPAADADDPDPNGDAFVSKFSPVGAVLWSTYLGGSQADAAYAIALDAAGDVYVAGTTESADFPQSGNSIPTCRTTGGPFVAELDPTGAKLLHSTKMSGLGYDNGFALTVASSGIVYLAGETESQVFFATPGAAQTTYSGGPTGGSYQAFAAAINFSAQPGTYAACVLNAASFSAGNEAPFPLGSVAPGEIVSLFGRDLGPGTPTVTFDGMPAPVLYAGPNQINAVVPYGLTSTTTQMTVQFNGQSYGPVAMPVAAAVPGIFTLNSSGLGQAAVINQDGTLNSVSNPAPIGSIISFYACGAGLMTPAVADGTISPLSLPLPAPVLPVSVGIRGVPATVQYARAAPGYVSGLLQVNVQVPTSINFGNSVPLMLFLGSGAGQVVSQVDVTIAVSLK